MVHEVRGIDGAVENGVHLLSSTEVDELIHKADEVSMIEAGGTPTVTGGPVEAAQTPKKEITGIEAKPGGDAQDALGDASTKHPVTMVFMGYQSVEDETETKKVLGLEGTVKAELVVIEDGESKGGVEGAKEDQAPPNGSAAEPVKVQEEGGDKGEAESGAAELNTKEKQPCKCCSIMWAGHQRPHPPPTAPGTRAHRTETLTHHRNTPSFYETPTPSSSLGVFYFTFLNSVSFFPLCLHKMRSDRFPPGIQEPGAEGLIPITTWR